MPVRPRSGRAPLWVAASLAICAGAASAAAAPDPAAPPPAPAAVDAALNVTGSSVVQLAVDNTYASATQVMVPINGLNYLLDLEPHSVRSPDFRLVEDRGDGQLHEVDPGPINTLRGTILGLEGSAVAGGMMPDGLYCTVVFPDGSQYWIEPLLGRVDGAGKNDYAVYRNGSALPGGDCGTTDDQAHGHDHADEAPGSPGERGLTQWTAQLATDADFEFYSDYGGTQNANSRISLIINTMNLQYQRDVDIRHSISYTVVRTTSADPYTATEEAVMNQQIETEWATQGGTWDLILVFTGTDRDLTGSVIGRANAIGSVCLSEDSNCWAWADFNNNFSSATDLCAHELGHLWDGSHCTCSNPDSTMNPSISSVNRFGVNANDTADTTIPAYRNTRVCLSSAASTLAPPNDACSGAIRLDEGTFGFNNTNAATDGPAVTGCGTGDSIAEDIWYFFIAPCDGTLTLTTCPGTGETSFDTVIVVYTGVCTDLTQVACNDDACGPDPARQTSVSVDADAGVTYRIRVGGFNGVNGNGVLNVGFTNCPAPPNNNCSVAGATFIEHDENYPFETFGATPSGPLEPADCSFSGDDTIGRDVWFRYVAPCSGVQRVSTCGSTFDTKLAVYTSCPGSTSGLSLVCNDDNGPGCAGLDASADFNAVANADYFIRVGGYNNSVGSGTIRVDPQCCTPPANDDCGAAAVATLGNNVFTNVCASTDGPLETADCTFSGDAQIYRDVWFRFVAPCSGRMRAILCGATYDADMAVYLGCPFAPGQVLACNDDSCGLDSQVTWNAASGFTYRIRIGGFGLGSMGTGPLLIRIAADWNGDNVINSSDISAYLTAWIASINGGNRNADFDNSNAVNSSDISAFLTAWIQAINNGCP